MPDDTPNLLRGARVYLSGPMDFVASRADEKKSGWRNRVGDFLRYLEATVFDPWFKPAVRGFEEYGLEDLNTIGAREGWTFAPGEDGDVARAPRPAAAGRGPNPSGPRAGRWLSESPPWR